MTVPRQSSAGRSFLRRFTGMVLVNLVAVTLVSAVGVLPMQRLGGPGSLSALLAGSSIVLLSACVAGVPACMAVQPGGAAINRMLAVTAIRMFTTLALALAAALSGRWSLKPLLVWVALAYMATLLVDTVWLTRLLKADAGTTPATSRDEPVNT